MARLRLYQRGKVWWIDGTVSNIRVRESTRETDRKKAEAIASRREVAASKEAEFGPEAVLTFGMATGLYLDAGKSERYLARIFAKWESRLVRDIKPGNVQDLSRELFPKAGPATRNRQVISPVQAIVNHAAKRGLCPPIRVERFFVPKPVRKVANEEWLQAFMSEAAPNLAALALFMASTGARISDAVDLRWNDVDLHAATALLRNTKNGETRLANLTGPVVVSLANLPRRTATVFGYKSRDGVQVPWANAVKRAKIEHISPHGAGRRLFATRMIQSGIDVVTTAEAGGWKSPRMVLDVYAQPGDAKAAVNAVFGNFESQPTKRRGVKT